MPSAQKPQQAVTFCLMEMLERQNQDSDFLKYDNFDDSQSHSATIFVPSFYICLHLLKMEFRPLVVEYVTK